MKERETDALAKSGNLSAPQFDSQSSTRIEAEVEADARRYAIICNIKTILTPKNLRE